MTLSQTQTLTPSGWAKPNATDRQIILELDGMWRWFRLEFSSADSVKLWSDGDVGAKVIDDFGEVSSVLLRVDDAQNTRSYANLMVAIRQLCPWNNVS